MAPTFFETQASFREWLATHHLSEKELLVGFYKVASGKPGMNWSQSVDQALCFGWIDGVRKSIDEHSYCIRFTPRKPNSIWSTVNIKKIEELNRQGLLHAAGLAAFARREEAKSSIYVYEQATAPVLAPVLEASLKANAPAWAFFQAQPPSYQKRVIHWVMSAKQEATRLNRLQVLMKACEEGKRV